MMSQSHLPVLAAECIEGLKIKTDGFYVDCTFGRGGHSRMMLDKLGPEGRLLAFDKDVEAINSSQAQAMLQDSRFTLQQGSFSRLAEVVETMGWLGRVDGILMDLGVSSPQLDEAHRGFSFLRDGPLDMRMDPTSGISAADWLAGVSQEELITVLKTLGEEKFARRIATAIIAERQIRRIERTGQLAELIDKAVPFREPGKHPATRSFQAIRIVINRELDDLRDALEQAAEVLAVDGRLAVISFHSLEDRIVKRFIREQARGGDFPKGLPVMADRYRPSLKKVGKPVRAGAAELDENIRSRSAILRLAQKVAS